MNNRRKILVVNKQQQSRIIIISILVTIILLNTILLAFIFVDPAIVAALDTGSTLAIALIEVLIVGAISYIGLIFSHRIAGPAYALIRDLNCILEGDLTVRTYLRKGDFIIDVGKILCTATEMLCNRIKNIQSLAADIADNTTDGPSKEKLNQLKDELSYFTTEKKD